MKKFFLGFVVGIVTTILFALALDCWWTSPAPDLSVELPASAEFGNCFTMDIIAFNPHSKPVKLGNVDIPYAFFESFEVVSVTPPPSQRRGIPPP